MLLYLATKLREMKYKKGFGKYITEIDWKDESFYIFTLGGNIKHCDYGATEGVQKKDNEWDFMFFENLAPNFTKYYNLRNFIGMVKESEGRNEFLEKLKPFIDKMKKLGIFKEYNMTEHISNIIIYKKNA